MLKAKVALVDLDGMIYAAGAVAETVYYTVDSLRFDFKTEANDYCDEHDIARKEIERHVDAQPVSHAINCLRTALDAAVRDADCDTYEAYLSPENNATFRTYIYPEYKANRANAHKPTHYKALRNWATRHGGAKIPVNMEADDIICIRAHELKERGVIVSVDKDFLQVPGTRYDWRKKQFIRTDDQQALMSLAKQVLIGDSVDNIKGCPGIGPAKANKILADVEDEEAVVQSCLAAYIRAYDGDEDKAIEEMRLNLRLVQLLKEPPNGELQFQ